jgi:hypothetical protein
MEKVFLFLVIIGTTSICFSQGELPVDIHTGTPQIAVSLYTISSYELSDPIILKYDAGGVKASASPGLYGINWNLASANTIQREVRGLPDDFMDVSSQARKSWLSPGVAESASAVPNTSDGSSSTCVDESTDAIALSSLNNKKDTEPDMFSYKAGEYSGQFIFDNSSARQIRLIPYQDIVITPFFVSATDKKITSFTITTNKGIVYQFDRINLESRRISSGFTVVQFFSKEADLYKSNTTDDVVKYTTEWSLSKVTAPSGAEIVYGYTSVDYTSTDGFDVYMRKHGPSGQFISENIFGQNISGNKLVLTNIKSSAGPEALFTLFNGQVTSINILDSRDGDNSSVTKKFVKKFDLQYTPNNYLKQIQESSGTESIPPYKFDYNDPFTPSQDIKGRDFWGYNNGKQDTHLFPIIHVYPQLPTAERFRIYEILGYGGEHYVLNGADRTVNPEMITRGSLNFIEYPWGGNTNIEYEPNKYYDATAGASYYGGGIRIKSATYLDGANPDVKVVKSYVYEDASQNSYGRLINPPAFVIPTWEYRNPLGTQMMSYGGTLDIPQDTWEYFTVRTDKDISDGSLTHGNVVGYKEVKVYRPNSGYAHFEFDMPGVWGDAAIGDWIPSINKFARVSHCQSVGILDVIGSWTYPYAPTPDIGYERGLVKSKREFAQSGALVRSTATTYQYLYKQGLTQSFKVWGVKLQTNPNDGRNTLLFGKYYRLTDVAKVEKDVTITTFDEADVNKKNTNLVQFYYASPFHKLLTKVQTTLSDGTIQAANVKYPLDYGTIPSGADKASEMIGYLSSNNRYGIPIEKYTTIKKIGGQENVVSGSITQYNDFGKPDRVVPQHQLSWRSSSPLPMASFAVSSVNATTKKFVPDSRYEIVNTILAYDSLECPSHSMGEDKVPITSVWSSVLSAPILTAYHVSPGQFAFSDFETGTEASFDLVEFNSDAGRVMRNPGRSGQYGVIPEVKMSKTIVKGGSNYVLSGWWGKYAESLFLTVDVKNITKTSTYYSNTFTLQPSTTTTPFDYFEFKIPVNSAPNDFYVELKFSSISGSGASYLSSIYSVDDIAFYPEQARLFTKTYQFPFGITSGTSLGNQTVHTVYDALGRVKYVLDKNKYIKQRTTYQFNAN